MASSKGVQLKKRKKASSPFWLITYSDIVTLLLCLFIMLYTIGEATPQEVQLILSNFDNSLGIFDGSKSIAKGRLDEMGMSLEGLPAHKQGSAKSEASKEVRTVYETELKEKKVLVQEDERGIIISLVSADYFNAGSALLTPAIEIAIVKAAQLAKNLKRFVRIEGHSSTDEEAIIYGSSDRGQEERLYKNTWDISASLAVNTASLMAGNGVSPAWLQAVGFGSYRPLALISPGTPEAAAHNRRVDIVLLSYKSTNRSASESNYRLPTSRIPSTEEILED